MLNYQRVCLKIVHVTQALWWQRQTGLKMTQAKARKLEGEAIKVLARTPEHWPIWISASVRFYSVPCFWGFKYVEKSMHPTFPKIVPHVPHLLMFWSSFSNCQLPLFPTMALTGSRNENSKGAPGVMWTGDSTRPGTTMAPRIETTDRNQLDRQFRSI